MYDPVRIRSHPGVRSDLFQRPVSSALVTDFFGGVAGVEVVDSDPFAGSSPPQDSGESVPRPVDVEKTRSASTLSTTNRGSIPRRRPARNEKSQNGGAWRAWAGLGLVGALAGFAVFQGTPRTKRGSDIRNAT